MNKKLQIKFEIRTSTVEKEALNLQIIVKSITLNISSIKIF